MYQFSYIFITSLSKNYITIQYLSLSQVVSLSLFSFFKFYLFIYLFIYGCAGSSLLRTGFLQLWQAGATLCHGAWDSHCGGFSHCGTWALGARASVVVARGLSSCGSWALERRLSSCGTWTQVLHSIWDLHRPGTKSVSPALAGGFLTTAPPGKSLSLS